MNSDDLILEVSERVPRRGKAMRENCKGEHDWRTSAYQPDTRVTRLWCHRCEQLGEQHGETGRISERPGFLIIRPDTSALSGDLDRE